MPQRLALVCFRLKGSNDLNQQLLDACNETGKIFMIHTKLAGKVVLRLAVGGLEQRLDHVMDAWELIRTTAEALLQSTSTAEAA